MPITVTIPVLNRKSDGPDVFPAKADAFSAALAVACPEMTALEENVNNIEGNVIALERNAVFAANVAQVAAANAALAAGVDIWISNTIYSKGVVMFSPISQQSYRRVSTGGGNIDPYYDSVNWVATSTNISAISAEIYGVVWNQSDDSYQVLSGINSIAVMADRANTVINVNLSGDVTTVGTVATIRTTKGVIWDQSNDSYTII
jgi:hypothetical protein